MNSNQKKNISVGWMALCALCVLFTFFLCVWKNGGVLLAETGRDPQETITAFFTYLTSGETEKAQSCLYGDVALVSNDNALSGLTEEAALLAEALRNSYSCTLSGGCVRKGETARQTILLSRLDATVVNNAAVTAAKAGMSYAAAIQTVLQDTAGCLTTDILTLNLRIADGAWKIQPDEPFLKALRGGLDEINTK